MSDQPLSRVPLFIQSELERLATVLDVTCNIGDYSGEAEYLYLLDTLHNKVEKLQEDLSTSREATRAHSKTQSEKLNKEESHFLKQSIALEQEVKQSLQQADDGLNKDSKLDRIMKKYHKEKDQRRVLETFIEVQNKKIKVLVEHVEKLVKNIKIESNKRLQQFEQQREVQVEFNKTKERIEKQSKIIAAQSRAIRELGEGSKMLEDQLRLMDEKYLELRGKFDLSRDHFRSKIKRMSTECNDLRVRYAKTHHGALLDAVKLDVSESRPVTRSHSNYQQCDNSRSLAVDNTGRLSPTLQNVSVNPPSLKGLPPLQHLQIANPLQTSSNDGAGGKRPPSPFLRSGTRTQLVTADSPAHHHDHQQQHQEQQQQYNDTMTPCNHSNYGMMRHPSEGTMNTADELLEQRQQQHQRRPFSASPTNGYDNGQRAQQRPKSSSAASKRLPPRQGGKKSAEDKALQEALRKIQKRTGSRVKEKWNAERLIDLLDTLS